MPRAPSLPGGTRPFPGALPPAGGAGGREGGCEAAVQGCEKGHGVRGKGRSAVPRVALFIPQPGGCPASAPGSEARSSPSRSPTIAEPVPGARCPPAAAAAAWVRGAAL